jgi:sulfide dehydrogenase cytochrome subunit
MKQKPSVTLTTLGSAILVWMSGASLAADYRPAMLANPCAGCHGTDGASPGPIPSIKGLSSKYLVSAMKDYKADKRAGTVMNRIAKGYTDEEINLIAEHFARAK